MDKQRNNICKCGHEKRLHSALILFVVPRICMIKKYIPASRYPKRLVCGGFWREKSCSFNCTNFKLDNLKYLENEYEKTL